MYPHNDATVQYETQKVSTSGYKMHCHWEAVHWEAVAYQEAVWPNYGLLRQRMENSKCSTALEAAHQGVRCTATGNV